MAHVLDDTGAAVTVSDLAFPFSSRTRPYYSGMSYPDDFDAAQAGFDIMSATRAVEQCATQVRVAAGRIDRGLVGIAPDSFRETLAREIRDNDGYQPDVDAWLGRQGITITWTATGAPGAIVDQLGRRADLVEPTYDLTLWPAAVSA
ncbi:hypothetical protein [Streptomyces niveus]|uniref:hypothetical protein n=1 Tax=Streptomyces niveus TaxID=193462 RepID=UPI00343E5879